MVAILAPPQCVKTASRLVNSTNQGKSSCTCEAYRILSRIEKTPINLQFYPAEKVRRWGVWLKYQTTIIELVAVGGRRYLKMHWNFYQYAIQFLCSAKFPSGNKSALVKPIVRYREGKNVYLNRRWPRFIKTYDVTELHSDLTPCGLVTPYGVGDLGQYWFR